MLGILTVFVLQLRIDRCKTDTLDRAAICAWVVLPRAVLSEKNQCAVAYDAFVRLS